MGAYTVKSGDTLSRLAQQFGYGSDYARLARENSIANPNLIRVGQVINYGGGSPAPAPAPTPTPAPAPAPVQNSQPNYSQPSYSAPSGPSQPGSATDLVNQGYYGYAGWNDAAALADFKATGGSGKGGPSSSGGISLPQAPTINLQSIYDQALNTAGVTNYQSEADAVTSQIEQRKQQLADAESKINDNPFYSEATRVGRIAKLRDSANADIQNLVGQQSNAQNKVSGAKADAQIRLNIASQQYNIQSQQYQQTLQQFNQLLTSGALNGVGEGDISQIAVSTGMSTSMVRSIIGASKAREDAANKPSLMTVDDGVNQKVVALDSKGNVINTQILGPTTKATVAGGGGDTTTKTNPNNPGGGAFTKPQYDQALKIIKYQDTANNGNDKGDHKLADWEVQAAVSQIAAYLGGDVEKAKQLFLTAANSGGYSTWQPGQ